MLLTAFLTLHPPVGPRSFCSLPHPHLQGRSGSDQMHWNRKINRSSVSLPEGYELKFPLRREETKLLVPYFRQNKQWTNLEVTGFLVWVLQPRLVLGENCCRVPGSWTRKYSGIWADSDNSPLTAFLYLELGGQDLFSLWSSLFAVLPPLSDLYHWCGGWKQPNHRESRFVVMSIRMTLCCEFVIWARSSRSLKPLLPGFKSLAQLISLS